MKNIYLLLALTVAIIVVSGCNNAPKEESGEYTLRPQKDTIGFASEAWQIDSVMARIDRAGWDRYDGDPWKFAICPHDDYTYTGRLYPEVLHNVKAPVVILIGVAHRAAALGIEDKLVFDTFDYWHGPYGKVKVQGAREMMLKELGPDYAMVSDTMHLVEHSLESMIPFLQYFNRNVEIIPVLVPAMDPDRMEEAGRAFAAVIKKVAARERWKWGSDFAIVTTTDAVHYGNEEWGGRDNARYGCDDKGNRLALALEKQIIDETLSGEVSPAKARVFSDYTLNPGNYREYIWTWCGRYSVPFSLHTVFSLAGKESVSGTLIDYYTSITTDHIMVDDLNMGITAIATPCHWVGYAGLGYN